MKKNHAFPENFSKTATLTSSGIVSHIRPYYLDVIQTFATHFHRIFLSLSP